MKKLSLLVLEAKQKFEPQEDTVNKINVAKLQKYLEVANKFISDDAKFVVNWLIEHPNYTDELANPTAENALADFYNAGIPKVEEYKELYKALGKLIKKETFLEVPNFQTKEQFEDIINKKISPDEILLDLKSESGRNKAAKQFDPLIWKVARSYIGKSNFNLEELYAIAQSGFVDAMNRYGKRTANTVASDEKIKSYTFASYAAQMMRVAILEEIKDNSNLIRIPRSVQQKERNETGKNSRIYAPSLDDKVGGKGSDGNDKTIKDTIGDFERAGKSIEIEDNVKLWNAINKALKAKFDEKTLDIFYSWFGVFGHEKLSGKELMAKYNLKNQSNISNICGKVISYMRKDPKLFQALTELYEFTNEMLHDDDMEDTVFEQRKLNL